MKYIKPQKEMACKVCGKLFMADRFRVENGTRTCCSRLCRNRKACRSTLNTGRKPIHSGCVGGELSPLYKRWAGMIARCHRKACRSYKAYGAKGITVCKEWRDSFPAFRDWSLTNGFSEELQIDRRKNELGYSPENCQWVTAKVNNLNRRCSIVFPTGEGTVMVALRLGIKASSLRSRLRKGMTKEEAMSIAHIPNGLARRNFRLKDKEQPAPEGV